VPDAVGWAPGAAAAEVAPSTYLVGPLLAVDGLLVDDPPAMVSSQVSATSKKIVP
jgi:hypothetical protein